METLASNRKRNRKSKRKIVVKTLFGLCALCFCVTLALYLGTLMAYRQAGAAYEELQQACVVRTEVNGGLEEERGPESGMGDAEMNVASDHPDMENAACPIRVDFATLKESIPDLVGWIYGEDTAISYPVVQGEDNAFYLRHMADGCSNASGAIFMDVRNQTHTPLSNEILYGHHMKNGSMFAGLMAYKSQTYYEAHPCFYYLTEEKNYRLEILRAGQTTGTSDIFQSAFRTKLDRAEYEKEWKHINVLTPVFDEAPDAPLMTLSTCSYEMADARFVVQGQLIEI